MKKLIFFLLSIVLFNCNGGAFGPGELSNICSPQIQYHLSSNCDDNSKIAIAFNEHEGSPVIIEIEDILSQEEIGECILVNLGGVFNFEGENVGSVYIVNSTDKSWLVTDCRE